MSESLDEVVCSICKGRNSTPYLIMDGFKYRKCNGCGLIFQNPRPRFEDLKKRYADNYFEYEISNQENFFNLMKLGLRDIHFDSFYGNNVKNKKFLDIGCATGLLLNYMKRKGWDTKGVELCTPSAEYAIKQFDLDVFIGTLEEAAFPDQYFDVVHFSHLIEHVPDPKSLLMEVKRILKRDGRIILTTPNADSFQAWWAGEKWRSAIPDHIYLFTKRTMRTLLTQTRFRIIRQISWGGIPAGKRAKVLKTPADKLAKFFNVGDVMLFHCIHA